MGLQDLPLEIFRLIIEKAVLENDDCYCGYHKDRFVDIAALSRVHPAFEREVFRALEKQEFLIDMNAMGSFQRHRLCDDSEFLARYLNWQHANASLKRRNFPALWSGSRIKEATKKRLQKQKKIGYHGSPWTIIEFPTFVNGIVDKIWMIEKLIENKTPRPIANATRIEMLELLLSGLSQMLRIRPRWEGDSWDDILRTCFINIPRYVLNCAIYMRKDRVVEYILRRKELTRFSRENGWGHPLQAAIISGNVPLTRRLILKPSPFMLRSMDLEDLILNVALWSKNACGMVIILTTALWRRRMKNTRRKAHLQFLEDAIHTAVQLGNPDVTRILVSMITRLNPSALLYPVGSIDRVCTQERLEEACCNGQLQLVTQFLKLDRKIDLDRCAVIAFNYQRHEVLNLLIQRKPTIKEYFWDLWTRDSVPVLPDLGTICLAGEFSGTTQPIRAFYMLEAASRSRKGDQKFRLLLKKRIFSLDTLLANEELIREARFGIGRCMTTAVLMKNVGIIETLAEYGVLVNDKEYYAREGEETPMEIAKKFSIKEVIELLEKLVARGLR